MALLNASEKKYLIVIWSNKSLRAPMVKAPADFFCTVSITADKVHFISYELCSLDLQSYLNIPSPPSAKNSSSD